jgi:hypothetical protein
MASPRPTDHQSRACDLQPTTGRSAASPVNNKWSITIEKRDDGQICHSLRKRDLFRFERTLAGTMFGFGSTEWHFTGKLLGLPQRPDTR